MNELIKLVVVDDDLNVLAETLVMCEWVGEELHHRQVLQNFEVIRDGQPSMVIYRWEQDTEAERRNRGTRGVLMPLPPLPAARVGNTISVQFDRPYIFRSPIWGLE